jgi:zinc-binding in reverse transcriptase
LKLRFPSLYNQVRYSYISAAELHQEGNWHLLPIANLDMQAQEEMRRLQLEIDNVHLTQGSDQVQWTREASFKFSAQSTYRFNIETPYTSNNISKLWEIKAPLRVQVFLWLLLRDKFLTMEAIRNREWIVVSVCYMCRQQNETVVHMFNECYFARQLRNYIADSISASTRPCGKYKTSNSPTELLTENQDMY